MSMIPMLHSLPTRRTARGLAVDIDCAEKSREASIRDALGLAIASPDPGHPSAAGSATPPRCSTASMSRPDSRDGVR